MEIEEAQVGLKRKTCAPFEEVMENARTRKKPKVDEEVAAFGKLLATQMRSTTAAVQPCREQ